MHEERIFVREGRKHFRRKYSITEVKIGAVVLAVLAAIGGWVAWRGANPDPALLAAPPPLPGAAPAGAAVAGGYVAGGPRAGAASGAGDAGAAAAVAGGARGLLPADLAPPGWREGKPTSFGPDDLYVKINGRADYYKSFGFARLTFLPLENAANPERTIDIELFDQGRAANALGAYQGERGPSIRPAMTASGMWHIDRNAIFLTWGRHYARVIASDESPESRAALEAIRPRLEAALPSEPLPWTYALFVGSLGLEAGGVSYQPDGAFSFGFARDVNVARLKDGESEIFVVARKDPADARAMAGEFRDGFLSLGSAAGKSDGVEWVKDRYLDAISGAGTEGPWVVGVRGAPDLAQARQALADLRRAIAALPPDAHTRARAEAPAPPPAEGGDAYGGGSGEAAAAPTATPADSTDYGAGGEK